jgi:hypothetical protein
MLSIEECKKILNEDSLTDEELAKLRNSLYTLISDIVDTS